MYTAWKCSMVSSNWNGNKKESYVKYGIKNWCISHEPTKGKLRQQYHAISVAFIAFLSHFLFNDLTNKTVTEIYCRPLCFLIRILSL